MSTRYAHATATDRASLMRAALACAERGWHVFPCAPGGKPPALRDTDWRQASTTDPAQIERWWTARPCNIGIDCGKSRLAVIDLDVPGHGHPGQQRRGATGLDALTRLCAENAQPLPGPTLTVATPSGGYHLYYHAPEAPLRSSTGRLAPLIDVRAAGGYIIAPGSQIAGRPYTLLSTTPLAPLPPWLATLHEQPPPPPQAPARGPAPVHHGDAYAQAALRGEATAVATTTRYPDAALNRAAYKLGQLAATGLLTETDIRDALTTAATTTGMPARQITRTITRGLTAGQRNPRQVPDPAPPPTSLLVPRQHDPGRPVPQP
ncbi:MAG: bifunctional DNA primase/polymerase [Nocardiopsaceae bacterium]|nr:bifunctional DNA primase/polymerase [Nocardiopsaceae bacterium]